jgi:Fe-S oxidoreductase
MPLQEYRELLHLCRLCGNCRQAGTTYQAICPAGERFGFDAYYSRGRAIIAQKLIDGEMTWTDPVAQIVYRCTMCGGCVEQCPVEYHDHILNVFLALRAECLDRSLISPAVKRFLETLYAYGNPWKAPRENRGDWAAGTAVKRYEPADEFLYYVGCVGSYDPRGMEVARAVGEAMLAAGVSFGILGAEEGCDGNEAHLLGEEGLFEYLATGNIQAFQRVGVRRIVTLSPHSYHVMRHEYPRLGAGVDVSHYTQLLRDGLAAGRLNVARGYPHRVTYHDPCFLGRRNGEYDAPRAVLRSIPGLELVEMPRSRENSFCCGGGAGNFYVGALDGTERSPERIRVQEARQTGAEIIAVACPNCMTMLEDALKVEGLEAHVAVKDIAEIVKDAMPEQTRRRIEAIRPT